MNAETRAKEIVQELGAVYDPRHSIGYSIEYAARIERLTAAITNALHEAEKAGRMAGLKEARSALARVFLATSDPTYSDAVVRIEDIINEG